MVLLIFIDWGADKFRSIQASRGLRIDWASSISRSAWEFVKSALIYTASSQALMKWTPLERTPIYGSSHT